MGYFPQYKLSSHYIDTTTTFSPLGSMLVRKSGELICLNYQFAQGLSNLVS